MDDAGGVGYRITGLHRKQAPLRPNIVVILADDLGYSDLGSFGGEIHTPHLDRLASQGVRMTQFYNGARCCPSRASLLTGLYPTQAGIGYMMKDSGVPGYRGKLNPHTPTIAEVLKPAGYRSYAAGKWHVSPHGSLPENGKPWPNWPLQRGFDRYYGSLGGVLTHFEPVLTMGNQPLPSQGKGYYYADGITDHALRFLREHRQDHADQPFFLYLPYFSPHWPLHAKAGDLERYEGLYEKGWDVLRQERLERMKKLGILPEAAVLSLRDPAIPPWNTVENRAWEASRMQAHAAMVDNLDQNVGRLVENLKYHQQFENTLIIFVSDNGASEEDMSPGRIRMSAKQLHDGTPVRPGNDPAIRPGPADTYASIGIRWANLSNAPFQKYKKWVNEGGISTPMFVHWPQGVGQPGQVLAEPAHLIDIMATCIEVSGAAYPESFNGQATLDLPGKSLVAAWNGGVVGHDHLVFEHAGQRALRRGKWKIVSHTYDGQWMLYDMEADRSEMTDLSGQYPELTSEMIAIWEREVDRLLIRPFPPQERFWQQPGS
jgi:arylsulfatase A-like enzyme